jgi:hypothetical protein
LIPKLVRKHRLTKVEAGDGVVTSPTREDSLTTGAENSADFPIFHVYGWG